MENVKQNYEIARERYAEMGVDTEAALKQLDKMPLSLHCWQGDDVGGFEKGAGALSGGIQTTGNHPGRARTLAELRQDLETVMSFVPGPLKVNLHASYLDCKKKVERDEIAPEHYKSWVDWAKAQKVGLDFNGTFFGHPLSAKTLTSPDEKVRKFWIDHGKAARKIGAYFGKELKQKAVVNLWIPDGDKDTPADLAAPRARLRDSLDQVFKDKYPAAALLDVVESKLFGIGAESYTPGSHEFYMGYAVKHGIGICLDTGHFHPTECVSDKISALLMFVPAILLHLSRGVRWDSDHVLTLTDEVLAIGREIARQPQKVCVGLDYFDASINRVAAWVIGARNAKKALLAGLLTPFARLEKAEAEGNLGERLALYEENRVMPLGAVWDYYCELHDVAVNGEWIAAANKYEKSVLLKRK